MSATTPERDSVTLDDHALIAAARERLFGPCGRALPQYQLAQVLGVTARQLSGAFRRTLGISMSDFVRAERVRIAQRLLLQTSVPVHSIAAQLGFSSPANFSSAFRQHTGMTPSQFRKTSPLSDLLTSESNIRWGEGPV